MERKRCSKCGEEKLLGDFYKKKRSKDNYQPYCKNCHSDMCRVWRVANPTKKAAKEKAWREQNAEYNRTRLKLWREANPSYKTERKKIDPRFKLAEQVRSRVNRAVRGKFKRGSAVRDLGCTMEELLSRFNQQAQARYGVPYTGNEHLFHIDHIHPLASFDLQDPYQLKQAVHYSNLQVLTIQENLSKGAKLPDIASP
jgi:hypothetical protein